jgi:hypothetical protein
VAAIRGDAQPLLGRGDAVGQAAALAALYRSADTGEAVAPSLNVSDERAAPS